MSEDDGFELDELPKAVDNFDPVVAGEHIANETFVLELHIHEPGFSKKLKAENFVGNADGNGSPHDGSEKPSADPNMLHVSQDLIDKKALKQIHTHKNTFVNWLKSKTVPCPMLASGLYLLPLNISEDMLQAAEEFTIKRRELVADLGSRYSDLIEGARPSRGDFFDTADYLPWAVIEPKFDCEYRPLTFNVPAALERINAEVYRREQDKIQVFFQDSAQMTRDALRISFQGLTEHLLEQLGTDETGKQKRFHSGSVKKMSDFIAMFSNGGNMTGDGELQQYVKMAKDLIEGVDPSAVRKNKGLRETLETGFAELKERTSTLIVSPKRKFNFAAEDSLETSEAIEAEQTSDSGLEID